jgi:hypothetical protein
MAQALADAGSRYMVAKSPIYRRLSRFAPNSGAKRTADFQ